MKRPRMFRTPKHDESGMTLIEMLATVIIMSIVIFPLTTALFQTMKLIPSASERTKAATDGDLLLKSLSDDIAQTQWASAWEKTSTGAGVPFFNTATGTAASYNGTQDCTNTALFFGSGVFWFQWTDASIVAPPQQNAFYLMALAPVGTLSKVTISRFDGTTTVPLLTGYCKTGDTNVLTINTTPSATNKTEQCTLTVNLRDQYGEARPTIVFDGAIRATPS